MLAYLNRETSGSPVAALDRYTDDAWVNVVTPSSEELDGLVANLRVERDLLQDALDVSEVPRAQEDKGVVYVFVRLPHGDGDALSTIPALFALAPQFLLTVCAERLVMLERFFGGHIPYSTKWRSQLFLKLMAEVVTTYQHAVTAMGKSLRHKISNFGVIDNADILQLVHSEGVLNDFIGALVPMQATLHSITAGKLIKMYEEDKDLIEDVQLAMGQVVEAAKSTLTTARNFREAYSAMLNNNLNRVVKLLTAATVVLTFPMTVFSFYGMNVALPLAGHPLAWLLVSGGTIALVASIVTLFLRKRWL